MPSPFRILLPLLLLLALLTGCSGTPRSTPTTAVLEAAGAAGVTIPSKRCANYFLIEATINGRGPFTMVLDTGASQTVVTPRVANALKEDTRRVNMYAEGSQGKRQDVDRVLTVRTLTIGSVELRGFDAITLDLSRIQATLGSNVDGILGAPAFKDVLLTIDYPNAAVRVAKGELPAPDGQRVLSLAADDKPMIDVRVGGKRRRFLLDTGKAGAFSVQNFDKQEFANPPATIAQGIAIGGSYVMRAGRLASDITLGDITFKHPVVESSDASDLIGAEALKTFVVVLDMGHRRVSFIGGGDRLVQFPPVRGIGIGFDYSDGGWSVGKVFSGLPAEAAGIEPGDWVIRLAGHRLRELSCTRQQDLYITGDSIDVGVIRKRQRMSFQVPIITLVP
jgi:predicted aspartyl protease